MDFQRQQKEAKNRRSAWKSLEATDNYPIHTCPLDLLSHSRKPDNFHPMPVESEGLLSGDELYKQNMWILAHIKKREITMKVYT